MGTTNWIVITTINPPSAAVRAFAAMPDWHVVVVGDEKTPKDWACEGVHFLPFDKQDSLGFGLAKHLPRNHYSRKMLGYLWAMRQGADVIADADDDTAPLASWGHPDFEGTWLELTAPRFVNIYRWYSGGRAWPRGFPLNHIKDEPRAEPVPAKRSVGAWQGLVNGDPDVDAIYRLTNGDAIYFRNMPPVVLGEGAFCPFNSQNTFWRRETFPLMYLPVSVSSRFSDILRSYVAQPIMWADGYRLGVMGANAVQHRNRHDLMVDFKDEVEMQLSVEDAAERVMTCGNLVDAYSKYEFADIWLEDLEAMGV